MTVFTPTNGGNVAISASTTSATSTLNTLGNYIKVANGSIMGTANVAYVKIGAGAQTATTADMPVLPGESVYIARDPAIHTDVGVILGAGTGIVSVCTGECLARN